MHCSECNTNKAQRERFEKSRRCGCCNGARNISFHRYVQYQLGWVTWLTDDGNADAPTYEMVARCESIIENCYSEYNKKGRPILERYCGNGSPSEVMTHYANQFKSSDTLTLY